MKNLLKAVAAFQQECPTIHKATQGYGYTYADLPAIFKVINPIMKKHGLGFMQEIHDDSLITTVFHIESGEMRESRANLIQGVQLKGMNDFQVFGSNLTYMRRYCLSCCLGIVTDKDIDAAGQQISQPKVKPAKPKLLGNVIKDGYPVPSEEWIKAREYIMDGGDIDKIKAKYDISPTLIQKLKAL
jgi:hypothetical protein